MMGKIAPLAPLRWLREYVGDRRRAPRRGARFAARIPAVVSLLEAGGNDDGSGASPATSVAGETRDLGPSGLTLIVGRVRVGGEYLTDAAHHLGVRLELPAGEVSLLARVVRFEQPPEGGGDTGYLLGLHILKVREEERAMFSGFLRTLAPAERRRRERGRQELLRLATPGAEMGPREDAPSTEEIARAFERFVGRGGRGGSS
jgi:hypothetical protein